MLSWEYPPRVVGGISSHVRDISAALARRGNVVHVVTPEFPGAPSEEKVPEGNGFVAVHRVEVYDTLAPDFPTWVSLMNASLERRAISLFKEEPFDVVHAHDWLVAEAAIGLKHIYRRPLVATVHATERGRRGGIFSQLSAHIDQEERWLVSEAWKVIVCSWSMYGQVEDLGAFHDKIWRIPNGVWPQWFQQPRQPDFRKRFASDDEKLVLFVGRLVQEKGVVFLLKAFPKVLESFRAKLVIVGDGYLKQPLQDMAYQMGVGQQVYLTGFLDEQEKRALYSSADVLVVPSLYEPFGIVALEGMASGVPVVVSNVGGLGEIVEHDRNGVLVYPGDPASIAWGILHVLLNPEGAKKLTESARRDVEQIYSWEKIAGETVRLYRQVGEEYASGSWKPRGFPPPSFDFR